MVAASTGYPLSKTSISRVEINENDALEPMDMASLAWPPIISTSQSGASEIVDIKRMFAIF